MDLWRENRAKLVDPQRAAELAVGTRTITNPESSSEPSDRWVTSTVRVSNWRPSSATIASSSV